MDRPDLLGLELAVTAQTWTELGFTVDSEGRSRVGGVELALGAEADAGTLTGWSLRGASTRTGGAIDGLPTRVAGPEDSAAQTARHPNGALVVDHVVVATPDLDRTLAAFRTAGFAVRAVRDGGRPERPLRQAFLLTGQALVEVVGPSSSAGADPAEPARFWGLTIAVADLDAAAALLGPRLGEVRDAVQPGRRIATVAPQAAGGLRLALMSPRPGRTSVSNTRPG